ncbi:hypothetical protein VCHC39A1_1871, partial [Vibrio cholerae HC-39A1]
MVCSCPGTR